MARLAQSLRANSIFIAMVADELSRTHKRPSTYKKPAQHLVMRVFEMGLAKHKPLPLLNDLGDPISSRSHNIIYSFEMSSHCFFIAIRL